MQRRFLIDDPWMSWASFNVGKEGHTATRNPRSVQMETTQATCLVQHTHSRCQDVRPSTREKSDTFRVNPIPRF